MFPADFLRFLRFFISISIAGLIVLHKTNASLDSGRDGQTLDPSFFFYQQSEYPRDCEEVHGQCQSRNYSGVYFIKPEGYPEPFEVYCDIIDGLGGWTVIQRRTLEGIVDFNRNWQHYKEGFGFLSREFWIGNERLSFLTNQKKYQLSIEMTLSEGSVVNVSYSNFRIGDEFSGYKLINVAEYSGITDDISWITCSHNMVYGLCSCGRRSCQQPTVCVNTCDGDETHGCICPEGFYMSGNDCVPREECGCFLQAEQFVVGDGQTYVNNDCTRIAVCSNGQLTRNSAYQCSPNGACAERDGVKRCYCNEDYIGDGESCAQYRDCMDLYNAGTDSSGTYTIKPTNWPGDPFNVYCNMTDGGGWTVFQRRIDGDVDFYLDWASYKNGFGDAEDEHWLGNEQLFYLTSQRNYQLRIDLVNRYGAPYYAKYTSFSINNEADKYRLSGLGTYSGTANYDALAYHRNQQFTTKDRDNDAYSYNCAVYYHGAWWYKYCYYSNLNGDYHASPCSNHDVYWYNLPGSNCDVKYTEMKIRPI